MVSLPRLVSVLGTAIESLTEQHLRRAVDECVPEHADLDWKREMYSFKDAGKKELAKDVAAVANTGGGVLVIGVDDLKQDHAGALAPIVKDPDHAEEWMRAVLANWIQPVVHGSEIRWIPSTDQPGRGYWTIAARAASRRPTAS